MSSFAVSVLEILSVHPCGRFISSISLQNLHCLFAIFKGCICRPLSNKIGFTSFGLQLQKIRLFGRRKRVLTLPICFYNILLDYDVSLHILVVLVVTIPTSPRISKTEFVCGRYRVFSFRFCCFSVTGSRPEPCWNLWPRPESPAHSDQSLRPAQAVTDSFWGRL